MTAFISISIYFLISVVFVWIVGETESGKRLSADCCDNCEIRKEKRLHRLQIFGIAVLFSVMYTIYNVYCTKTGEHMGGDRFNYSVEFEGIRKTSVGLTLVFKTVKFFSGSIYEVFYITTFLYVFVCIYVFIYGSGNNKASLTFFVLTDAIFFSFTALKQIYACMFASVCFLLLTKKKSVKRSIACWILIFLSCIFHDSAIVLIPVYLGALFLERDKANSQIMYVLIILAVTLAFFDKIVILCSEILSPLLPDIAAKMKGYFTTASSEAGASSLAFIKGTPFYAVLIFGVLKRDEFIEKIEKYDLYLFLSAWAAGMYFCMIYSYWMYRATAFFYVPVAIFCSKLREQINSADRKMLCGQLSGGKKNILHDPFNRNESIMFDISIYFTMFVILLRWIILIYRNYGGF